MSALFPGEFTYRVVEAASIGSADLAIVQALFAENYREANLAYLEKSLGKLRYLALATHVSGAPAGFALGESRMLDLPRLPQTTVRLAGLCCVGMAFRRQGLFVRLEGMVLSEGRVPHGDRWLATGRMAHPGSFRSMSKNGSVVPRRGVRPTPWQQAVGAAIAAAYGSPFDPETFVCKGSGVPIGYPVIELDCTPEEWELFAPVDRSKGDSLLGISWSPDAPPRWDDPEVTP